VLRARAVQSSEDDLSEHDAHCRQRFENHDDVQLVKLLDVFAVVAAIVVVVVVLPSSLVAPIVSI
jgi:hypothetical protein